MQEPDNQYYVEQIVAKRMNRNKPQYLIKWEGFPKENSTWEPIENLQNVLQWVEEFEKKTNNLKEEKRKEEYKKMNEDHPKVNGEIEMETQNSPYKANISDIPIKVLNANIIDNTLCFQVEWDLRPDGIILDSSYVKNNFLKDNFPKILIDFYESKIKFVKKNKNNN